MGQNANFRRVTVFAEMQAPGDGMWSGTASDPDGPPAYLTFRCPCGCGMRSGISVAHDPAAPHKQPWTWNGDLDKPDCSPSIRTFDMDGQEHWHGYLRNGVFESC